jgi:hypothetical protein
MPLRYWYSCTRCHYRAYRYRNVKRCPDCRGTLIRDEGFPPTGTGVAVTGPTAGPTGPQA